MTDLLPTGMIDITEECIAANDQVHKEEWTRQTRERLERKETEKQNKESATKITGAHDPATASIRPNAKVG